jgi:hypothetical protein
MAETLKLRVHFPRWRVRVFGAAIHASFALYMAYLIPEAACRAFNDAMCKWLVRGAKVAPE